MLVTREGLAWGETTPPGDMVSSSVSGAAGAARSLGACHRTEQGVREPCGKGDISLPWRQGVEQVGQVLLQGE